jgi:hypothetical protein
LIPGIIELEPWGDTGDDTQQEVDRGIAIVFVYGLFWQVLLWTVGYRFLENAPSNVADSRQATLVSHGGAAHEHPRKPEDTESGRSSESEEKIDEKSEGNVARESRWPVFGSFFASFKSMSRPQINAVKSFQQC